MSKMPHRQRLVMTRDVGRVRFRIVSNWPRTQWWMAAQSLNAAGEPDGTRPCDEKCTKSIGVVHRWQGELERAEKPEDVPMPAITVFASERKGSRGSAWGRGV